MKNKFRHQTRKNLKLSGVSTQCGEAKYSERERERIKKNNLSKKIKHKRERSSHWSHPQLIIAYLVTEFCICWQTINYIFLMKNLIYKCIKYCEKYFDCFFYKN